MMKRPFERRLKLAATCVAGLALLAGCDQREDRIERAKTLAEVSLDQINGKRIEKADNRSALERAEVGQRALAGTLRNDMNVRIAAEQSRFAVTSIVAKPIEFETIEEDAFIEPEGPEVEPEPMLDAVIEEEIAPAPTTGQTRSLGGDGASDQPSPPAARAPQAMRTRRPQPKRRALSREQVEQLKTVELEKIQNAPRYRSLKPQELEKVATDRAMKVQRRTKMSTRSLTVQQTAESKTLDKMDKLGLQGRVKSARGGQMVIELVGVEPTQFAEDSGPKDIRPPAMRILATENGHSCDNPDAVSREEIKNDPALAAECMVQALRATGDFEYVEKDFIFQNQFSRLPKPTPAPVTIDPNDPLWALQWHFQNAGTGENQTEGGAGFLDFWTREGTTGSKEVVVAVVDTGLQMSHPDIVNSPNVAPGWDMVSEPAMGNDGDGRDSDPNDPGDLCDPDEPFAADSFHGTHVAGTIGAAATNNGDGVAGGAWDVTIVPVRALGKCGGKLSDINDAIRWAAGIIPAEDPLTGEEVWNENPADIINLSIGLYEYCPASMQDAIDSVSERGVTVVAAAGNARIDTAFYAPGGCNNVISVAAGDARGHIAPYSNYGDAVDILAPGGDLTRDDNGDGRPDGVLSTKSATNCYDPVTQEGVADCFYAYEQGTSMAAPHVSAALALLMAKYPDLESTEIGQMLLNASTPRDGDQCLSPCASYPGAEPSAADPSMCIRPCGGGLLNLAGIGDAGALGE